MDALAAAPLAGKTAPILLTDNNTLTAATQAELVKLGVKNVYVVGSINQTVVDQVNTLDGVTSTVLKGPDRIGTVAAISSKVPVPAGSFVVGYGALADALSVASYAAANNYLILVANPDGSLPASEAVYQGSTVYIIGGPTLVADIPGATRLFGIDRFATNQAVLNALTYTYDNLEQRFRACGLLRLTAKPLLEVLTWEKPLRHQCRQSTHLFHSSILGHWLVLLPTQVCQSRD